PNGVAYITINDRYINLLSSLGTCQTTACAYNDVTMSGKVDFNDCKIVSWGASDA
ncbi:cell wall protein DAN4, partial [Biomphalaria glabrata]